MNSESRTAAKASSARETRVAEALRENLRKRKAQAQTRAASNDETKEKTCP